MERWSLLFLGHLVAYLFLQISWHFAKIRWRRDENMVPKMADNTKSKNTSRNAQTDIKFLNTMQHRVFPICKSQCNIFDGVQVTVIIVLLSVLTILQHEMTPLCSAYPILGQSPIVGRGHIHDRKQHSRRQNMSVWGVPPPSCLRKNTVQVYNMHDDMRMITKVKTFHKSDYNAFTFPH